MPQTPTFGRYLEIPYDRMPPEQQEAYRFAVGPTAAQERRGREMGLPAEKVEALLSGLPTLLGDKREQVL